jgi:porcupine-like protein
MDAIQGAFSMPIPWMVQECALPVVYQGLYLTYPILISSLAIRLCVLWLPLRELIYDVISFSLGAWVLWWYYQSSVVYFVVLLIFIYSLLLIVPVGKRGVVVGGACMMFVIVCELFIASAAEWHKVRGTFMVVSMKLVSLAYDVDSLVSSCPLPSVIRYLTYSIFPATTIFGPYVTYNEHVKYTQRTSLSMNWFFHVIRSLTFSLICLSFSSCFFVFLFEDNSWNKWLTAYSSASSFRFSHFFVSLLSECSTIMSGLGYSVKSDGHVSWKGFRVVYPLDVEIPRSMGSLVTSWNIPMHHFLKNYVFKPTLVRLNYIGAFFFTFLTSALLHVRIM